MLFFFFGQKSQSSLFTAVFVAECEDPMNPKSLNPNDRNGLGPKGFSRQVGIRLLYFTNIINSLYYNYYNNKILADLFLSLSLPLSLLFIISMPNLCNSSNFSPEMATFSLLSFSHSSFSSASFSFSRFTSAYKQKFFLLPLS